MFHTLCCMIEKTAFIVKYIVLEIHNPLIWRSLADTQKTNKLFGRSMFDETDKKKLFTKTQKILEIQLINSKGC